MVSKEQHSMIKYLGAIIVAHGIVYAIYGYFDVFSAYEQGLSNYQPELGWTGESWLLTPLLADNTVIIMALIGYLVASLLFIFAGFIFMTDSHLWRVTLITASVFASVVLLVFWDGSFTQIIQKGLIGLVINIGITILAFQK